MNFCLQKNMAANSNGWFTLYYSEIKTPLSNKIRIPTVNGNP